MKDVQISGGARRGTPGLDGVSAVPLTFVSTSPTALHRVRTSPPLQARFPWEVRFPARGHNVTNLFSLLSFLSRKLLVVPL